MAESDLRRVRVPVYYTMTPAERHSEMMERVKEIVGEHCDSWVFAAQMTNPTDENPDAVKFVGGFAGSGNECIGGGRCVR